MQIWRSCSHTAIHLSLHSINKCHLYTEATHISLLADIIDACLSGYIYWLIATASVLRVRSNNKSWWWPSDTLNSQSHFEIWENCFHWFDRTVYYTYHGGNILKMCDSLHLFLQTCHQENPFLKKAPPCIIPKKGRWWNGGKKNKFNTAPAVCCELLSKFNSCLNLVQGGDP